MGTTWATTSTSRFRAASYSSVCLHAETTDEGARSSWRRSPRAATQPHRRRRAILDPALDDVECAAVHAMALSATAASGPRQREGRRRGALAALGIRDVLRRATVEGLKPCVARRVHRARAQILADGKPQSTRPVARDAQRRPTILNAARNGRRVMGMAAHDMLWEQPLFRAREPARAWTSRASSSRTPSHVFTPIDTRRSSDLCRRSTTRRVFPRAESRGG